ncbi:HAMP domain-containing protein [Streptomyces sp. TRM43335]|uniref:HAMP domain-containing protein n=1 Tax=Streptomyces taklimakanensis TaxID=2569853 RepID=A0A6G2BBN9_9ACTN|nr:cache and HAMP domain-containing protein [Streptomyces taklimakanensis]MTE19489.1 HAMP domain-containing protein [Streptomyces taklimakanensis]
MSLIGGIRPPIATLAALLLFVAGVTAFTLGRVDEKPLPEAVLTSQQHFAEDGAIALRASLDESVTDLNRAAALFNAGEPVSPDAVLDKIGSVYQKWRGTAIIEIESGRLLAARGENLPLTTIDRGKLGEENGLAPRMVRLENGETRLLSFALLSWEGQPQQLLVASGSLRFPGISLGKFRAIAVIDSSGSILSSDGIPEPEQVLTDLQRKEVEQSNKQLKAFAETAAEKARAHPLKAKDPGSGGFLGVSGSLVGEVYQGERSAAGYATLAAPKPGESTVATSLGLTVVAMVGVAEDPTRTTDTVFGLAAAGVLLVIGALAVTLLLGTVQRPLIRLFLESRRLTRGDLRRPVSVPRFGETARIGHALERLRLQLLDGTGGPDGAGHADAAPAPARASRRLGTRAMLAVCAALLLLWSAPMVLLLNRAEDTAVIPQQLVNDQRERTDTLTDRVRRALNEGHADLVSVASLIGDRTAPEAMATVLERTAYEHLRYQSLYVLDAEGKILAQAGEEPRHPAGQGPGVEPIAVLGEGGKEPIIAGYAEVPGREGAAVVGEFRIDFLNSLLKRPGLGEVRVVDAERRVIGGNTGYRAFQKLPSDRLDALVAGSNQQVGMSPRPSSVLYRDGDGPQVAASAPFVGGGAAKPLGWTVVSWQPASGLEIPEYTFRNRTILAGLLGLTAAAACLGWLHIVVVRPLRELARQAEALADGDRRTVLYPRHHDEVGAVVRSLELIRQALLEQRRRDGAAAPSPVGRI